MRQFSQGSSAIYDAKRCVFLHFLSHSLSLCFLSAKVCARQDRYYWRAGASQPSRVTGTIFHVVFCLSRCISRFYDFTQATLYRKSLQFHVYTLFLAHAQIHRYDLLYALRRAHGSYLYTTAGRFACSWW